MKLPTQCYTIAWGNGQTPSALCAGMEEIPMIYQQHPADDKGKPILPHVWTRADGSMGVQVGATWTEAAPDAPAKLAAYIARTVKLGPSKMLGLNIESIPLETIGAINFWTKAIAAIRSAVPGVRLGFYDRVELGHLVDWFGVSLYPAKRIAANSNAGLVNRGEYFYIVNDYIAACAAHAAPFVLAARQHFRPLYAFATFRLDGDAGDAPGFLGVSEIDAQLAYARDIGADVIWWNSVESPKVARRVGALLAHFAKTADTPRVWSDAAISDQYPIYV